MSTLEFLGGEMRRFRQERGLSQEQIAKEINYSPAMVAAVETARRTPSHDFIARLEGVLETGGLLDRLLTLARADAAPPWFREWISVEREATLIRWFEPSLIPGLLQTEAYARAVLTGGGVLHESEVEEGVCARLERQSLLSQEKPPEFVAVVDEIVLRRPVGEPAVMIEQFTHLLEVTESPRMHIHVVPAEVGMHAGLAGPFILARMPEGGEVAHLDTSLRAHITDNPKDIDILQRRWESLRSEALPQRASRDLIKELVKSWT